MIIIIIIIIIIINNYCLGSIWFYLYLIIYTRNSLCVTTIKILSNNKNQVCHIICRYVFAHPFGIIYHIRFYISPLTGLLRHTR